MPKTLNKMYAWGINRYLQIQQVAGLLAIINFFMIFHLTFGVNDPVLIIFIFAVIGIGAYILDGKLDFRGKTFGSHAKKNPWARDVTRRLAGIEEMLKDREKG